MKRMARMNISRLIKVAIVGAMLSASLADCQQADAQIRMPFRRATEDTNQSFDLTQSAGPWLIMCHSFSGESAVPQARRLATELRERYNLKTYIYSHHFDLTKSLPKQGLAWQLIDSPEQDRKLIVPQRMKPAGLSEFEEVAVLVGDFPTIDDNNAQSTLEKVKSLRPDSLVNFDPRAADDDAELAGARLRSWREDADKFKKGKDPEYMGKGPMGAAFLLTNPTLPDEYFQAQKVDAFVLKLNQKREIKNSLLKNPGAYSVRVASFRGDSTFNLNEIEENEQRFSWLQRNNKARKSNLMDAGMKAHKLAEAFRAEGVEAYEFHDRHESYVCVGSFDWIVETDAQGNKRQNPEVVQTILKYKGSIENLPGMPNAVRPYVLPSMQKEGIACDVQPVPVLVPRVDPNMRTATGFLSRFK